MKDNGGRRRLADRRSYTHRNHFPERRGTRYRRSASDRRDRLIQPPSGALGRRQAFIEHVEAIA